MYLTKFQFQFQYNLIDLNISYEFKNHINRRYEIYLFNRRYEILIISYLSIKIIV